MSNIEHWARWLAERYTDVYVRRDDDPVDVCRWHRELAEDILKRIAATDRGAVEALRRIAAVPDEETFGSPPNDAEMARIAREALAQLH